MMKKRFRIIGALLVFFAGLLIVGYAPVGVNLWFLAIDPAYVIPKESSIFVFKPTVMNPGSGDWWIYGEDKNNFYHFTGESPFPYVSCSRKLAAQCTGFQPTNHETWCVRN